jgi:plastocyanin
MSSTRKSLATLAALTLVGVAACNTEPKSGDQSTSGAPAAAASAASSAETFGSGPFTPDPGGKVIVVELYTDGVGNYFKPAEVHVKPGDVVRYTLKVGVHNVHFLADSNANKSAIPQVASDFLQLPGQTWDLLVRMPKGTYYFQCDPHAALGMKGHVIVE